MQQWEYHDNKKILDRFQVKVEAPVDEREQVNCIVTESHVVVDSQQPIEIPMISIKRCDIYHSFLSYTYNTYTPRAQEPLLDDVTLTYLDELNRTKRLKFKIIGGGGFSFEKLVDSQRIEQKILRAWAEIEERPRVPYRKTTAGDFLYAIKEIFRDKTRDRICAGLRMFGIDAQMSPRGRIEERICGGGSLGITDIKNSLIDWINIRKETRGNRHQTRVYYVIEYGVPDKRLGPNSHLLRIETVSVKTAPLFGRVKDIRWEGEDLNLGIISRLNDDISLKSPIMKSHDLSITANGKYGYWIISTEIGKVPSTDLWDCYEAIARHLLADWTSI